MNISPKLLNSLRHSLRRRLHRRRPADIGHREGFPEHDRSVGLVDPGNELSVRPWPNFSSILTAPGQGATRPLMNQKIILGSEAMVAAAAREIETIPAAEAIKLLGRDDVVFVDIRDIRELKREGRIPGAFHCPRGMLEFWIDPQSPYHKPVFADEKKFIFFCAGAKRSALATQTAQNMGLKPVAHLAGGFGAWKKAGGPVEMDEKK